MQNGKKRILPFYLLTILPFYHLSRVSVEHDFVGGIFSGLDQRISCRRRCKQRVCSDLGGQQRIDAHAVLNDDANGVGQLSDGQSTENLPTQDHTRLFSDDQFYVLFVGIGECSGVSVDAFKHAGNNVESFVAGDGFGQTGNTKPSSYQVRWRRWRWYR